MQYPVWKYRKHPKDGFFQSTLVLNKEADEDLHDWNYDPKKTGFELRPANEAHRAHPSNPPLMEPLLGTQSVTHASIEVKDKGDING